MASKEGIDSKTVKRVLALRKKGVPWLDIIDQLGQPRSFILKVRPLMKQVDPDSVLPIGPGSPTYGKNKKAKVKARA